jgi:hypothetical protein
MAEAILLCGCTLASQESGSRETVGSRSTVGLVALTLAVAVLGAGTAFAQTPVVPVTTVPGQPDDQSKLDPNEGEDKAKAEKPKAEAPKPEKPNTEAPKAEAPKAEAPKAEAPKPEAPKPEKPKTEAPKAEKPEAPKPEKPKTEAPKTEAPKPEKPKTEAPKTEAPKADKPGKPRGDEPNPEAFMPAQPEPTTESPNPAQPKRAPTGATSIHPNEPGLEPQGDGAKPVSPRAKAAPVLATSPDRHVTDTRSPAAERNPTAARRPATAGGRDWSGTSSARSGGDSADATPVPSEPAAIAPRRAPRLASAHIAAGAAALLDRQQPRPLLLGGPPRDNVLIPLLLAILYAAGFAYVIRREYRRGLGLGTRRPPPARRGARRWPAANGRERVDRQVRRRLVLTRSGSPRGRSGSRDAPPV